jgi:predicted permease
MSRRTRLLEHLEEDIRDHIDREMQQNIDRGMSKEEARRAALCKFGNVTRVIEDTREVWSTLWFDRLLQDMRFGLRTLLRSRSFAFGAALSLALGIGANTAIFSLVDAIILKSLPVREPSQLVQLEQTYRGEGYNYFSYPAYLRLRESQQVFSSVFGWANQRMSGGLDNQLQPIEATFVTGNYFSSLGVQPLIGRTILPGDDVSGAAPVAVLSYATWREKFGSDPGVVGRTITLEHIPVIVIGVSPSGFFGTEVGHSFEVAVPLSIQTRTNRDEPLIDRADAQWMRLMARLAPNVTEQQAREQCEIIWPRIIAEVDPKGNYGIRNFGLRLEPASTGLSKLRQEFSRPLFVLLAIAGIVLVIACANAANLLLARASARQREVALRFALGASRWRIIRQMLVESVVLAALGGAVGLIFAVLGAQTLVSLLSAGVLEKVTLNVALDWRILAFNAGAALISVLLFGSIPAFRATGDGQNGALNFSSRTIAGGRRSISKVLIVAQVALNLPLLLGAGLFVRSFDQLLNVDAGFRRDGVLLFHINPARAGYKSQALANLYEDLLRRISVVPGVHFVGLSTYPPLTGGGGTFFEASQMLVDGRRAAANDPSKIYLNQIGSHFLDSLGISLISGRDFGPNDDERAPKVVIVSEALARTFFPNENAVGHRIQLSSSGTMAEIVGVAKTMKYETLREAPHYIVFDSYLQSLDNMGSVYLEARSDGNLSSIASTVRKQIAGAYPEMPLEALTLTEWVNQFLIDDRLLASLAGVFGLLATVLAALGLYGVMSYTVTQRTREIGVRIALGAGKRDVLELVLREAAILVIVGLAIGIPFAISLGHFVASMLFRLSPSDPLILLAGAIVLALVALGAACIPARRAAGVDPTRALRIE